MKHITKIKLGLALTFSLGLTSCGDWLDLQPENSVTASNYWMSEQDVSSAMTGIYCNWMKCSSSIWEQSEMRADMVMPGATKSDYSLVRDGNITSSNSLVKWANYYNIINQCNLLLDRSHIALENDPAYTVTQDSIYHAQARVVRDMMYFYLIRIWKDVPYITTSFYDDTRNRDVAASSQMDILNACIADLEAIQSQGILPFSYSSSSGDRHLNKGQVTMYMLKALLADMYRMKGSYETDRQASQDAYRKCLALCNAIIESGQYALVPFVKSTAEQSNLDALLDCKTHADSCFYNLFGEVPTLLYEKLYGEGNSNECIMELQEDSYNSSGFFDLLIGRRFYAPNIDNLQNALFLSTEKEVAAMYRYRDVRFDYAAATFNGNLVIGKNAAMSMSSMISSVTEYRKNVLVYRLAEIYLMKAEVLTQIAMANGNDQATLLEAYRALFAVRDRASAVETTDLQLGDGQYMQDKYWNELRENLPIELNDGDINAAQLEKLVLDEEARELAFEGRRWFDLLRNAERNNEGKGSCTGGNIGYLLSIAGSCAENDKVAYIAGQLRKPDFRYLPYPYSDVTLNKNLNQKPFWGNE